MCMDSLSKETKKLWVVMANQNTPLKTALSQTRPVFHIALNLSEIDPSTLGDEFANYLAKSLLDYGFCSKGKPSLVLNQNIKHALQTSPEGNSASRELKFLLRSVLRHADAEAFFVYDAGELACITSKNCPTNLYNRLLKGRMPIVFLYGEQAKVDEYKNKSASKGGFFLENAVFFSEPISVQYLGLEIFLRFIKSVQYNHDTPFPAKIKTTNSAIERVIVEYLGEDVSSHMVSDLVRELRRKFDIEASLEDRVPSYKEWANDPELGGQVIVPRGDSWRWHLTKPAKYLHEYGASLKYSEFSEIRMKDPHLYSALSDMQKRQADYIALLGLKAAS